MTICQIRGQIIITVKVQNGKSSHQARVVRTALETQDENSHGHREQKKASPAKARHGGSLRSNLSTEQEELWRGGQSTPQRASILLKHPAGSYLGNTIPTEDWGFSCHFQYDGFSKVSFFS